MNLTLGIIIITITFLGYFSNFLNGRYLNFFPINLLYYLGAIIHETSHAIMCVFTGAKITDFSIFSSQPHVSHQKSKIPFFGQTLISLAPMAGGILFLYIFNHFLLKDYLDINSISNIEDLLKYPFFIISQLNLLEWQTWLIILISLNSGAMLGPSTQDLKNIWPVLLILFFVKWNFLAQILFLIISLIVTNIIIQIGLIIIKSILRKK